MNIRGYKKRLYEVTGDRNPRITIDKSFDNGRARLETAVRFRGSMLYDLCDYPIDKPISLAYQTSAANIERTVESLEKAG